MAKLGGKKKKKKRSLRNPKPLTKAQQEYKLDKEYLKYISI